VQVRALQVAFDLTQTDTDPPPAPLAGVTITQLLQGLLTVQAQSLDEAVTITWQQSAPDPGEQVVGNMVKLPVLAAWFIDKLCPPMDTLQERGLHERFTLADTVIDPLPVPLIGVTVTQLLHGLVTVQLQSPLLAVMVTVVVPPPASVLQFVALIVNVPELAA